MPALTTLLPYKISSDRYLARVVYVTRVENNHKTTKKNITSKVLIFAEVMFSITMSRCPLPKKTIGSL